MTVEAEAAAQGIECGFPRRRRVLDRRTQTALAAPVDAQDKNAYDQVRQVHTGGKCATYISSLEGEGPSGASKTDGPTKQQ